MLNWYKTQGADDFLTKEETNLIASRYIDRDWGDTNEDDKQMNEEALKTKDRIVAKYIVRDVQIYIITEYGHEITTILLSEEY